MAMICLLVIGKMEISHGNKFNLKFGQTMKKIFMLMASAAVVFAASCNKMEEVNTPIEPVVETELITVDLNPMTKTSLDGKATVWSEGDKVSVTVGGKNIGDLELVKGTTSTFKGEVEAGYNGEAILNYPSGTTEVPATQKAEAGSFANGAALLEGKTTMEALRAGEGASLSNTTALLQFEVSIAGDVAFKIGDKTYTVTGCETGNTYYACVDPNTSGKLSYTVGIVLGGKEKDNFVPEANKIYPLGKLALKESVYGVIGDNNGWAGDAMMYETSQTNLFVAYGIKFASDGGFKVRKAGSWSNDDANYGTTTTTVKEANTVVGVYTDGGSGDIKIKAGTYDLYFDRANGQVYITTPGKPHTELTQPTAPTDKYSLIGTIGGSSWNKDFNLKYSGDNIWTLEYNFTANNEWKVRKNAAWSSSWGYSNLYPGNGFASNANGNVKMTTAGDYIVTFVLPKNKITLVKK